MSDGGPVLLDAHRVAALLGVSVNSVRMMDVRGRLPRPARIGRAKRWVRSEVLAWAEMKCPTRLEFESRAAVASRDQKSRAS